MSRTENIFFGVVNNENSMTELLCNYMAYKPFRNLFLSLFLNESELVNFQYTDFNTQYTVELSNCRPDIVVENDEYKIFVEVKTSNSGLTENQPVTYLQHLDEMDKQNKFLIFLIPFGYASESEWESKVWEFKSNNNVSTVQTKVIYWNELIKAIQKSELYLVSEKINEFYKFLKLWFEFKEVRFTNLEVSIMHKPEIPSIMLKLFEIVNDVKNFCSKDFKAGRITSNSVEYSVYFLDEEKNYTLFFGIWYEFWNEHKIPLCYGMDVNWDKSKLDHFRDRHKTLIEFENYLIASLPENIYTQENCSEEIANIIFEELALFNKV